VCTCIISVHPNPAWPILLAANRDEKLDRPSRAPAAHWPDQPDVTGGLDERAGGTWLAVRRDGMLAAVLNRLGSLGPAPGKRSRGELPLIALRHATAEDAASALSDLNGGHYRSFNLIIAGRDGAWWLRGTGQGPVRAFPLTPGVHIITARDPDDQSSPRVARNLPRFRAAPAPNPPDWSSWPALLADNTPPSEAAINIPAFSGFGTVGSALAAIPAEGEPVFLHAGGPPHEHPYVPVRWTTS
jgi:hypothetical protein